jgi:sialic acid synthase SpsE
MKNNELFKIKEPFFIAEIGLNHNGNYAAAEEMIRKASECGADAVKFQTFVPELMNSLFTRDLLSGKMNPEPDMSIIDFFRTFVFSEDEYRRLRDLAHEAGLIFFSAPFDTPSVDMLERIDIPLYKVASSEITNIPLLERIGLTGKPVLLSTGMAREDEIDKAVSILKGHGSGQIVILHCVSLYPLEAEEANLGRITALKKRFNTTVGLSDHSRGTFSAGIAAALGAKVFEKHFRLNHNHDCPDKDVSATPEEFKFMVESVKLAITMTGTGAIECKGRECETAKGARRSLFAAEDIKTGTIIREKQLIPLRPGTGIPVSEFYSVTGKQAVVDIKKGSLIKYSDIS